MKSDICLSYTHIFTNMYGTVWLLNIFAYIHVTCVVNLGHIPEEKIIRMAMNHQIRPPFGKAYFLRDSQLAGVVYHSIVGEKMLFNLELKFHIFPRCWQKFACADMLTPHLPFWQCELDKLCPGLSWTCYWKTAQFCGFHTDVWDQLPFNVTTLYRGSSVGKANIKSPQSIHLYVGGWLASKVPWGFLSK